ncbi:hypothetical protein [Goodfellowiella coeruleoviolacea]|uniref:Uncharacterized protein n=1 Tax=Goodfellowiella coeruleoviolacea TaxID=334858 RepID=A0AAE3KIL4_9PSEU|nr:hypothetical protein [Goodfellowiella coeruleoviolacea]MCP2168112.1 hypothetical protein [Goodfellowiella coeruleoviolacea]
MAEELSGNPQTSGAANPPDRANNGLTSVFADMRKKSDDVEGAAFRLSDRTENPLASVFGEATEKSLTEPEEQGFNQSDRTKNALTRLFPGAGKKPEQGSFRDLSADQAAAELERVAFLPDSVERHAELERLMAAPGVLGQMTRRYLMDLAELAEAEQGTGGQLVSSEEASRGSGLLASAGKKPSDQHFPAIPENLPPRPAPVVTSSKEGSNRLTTGLLRDVVKVLERHGFHRPDDRTAARHAMGGTIAGLIELCAAFEGSRFDIPPDAVLTALSRQGAEINQDGDRWPPCN